MQPIEENIELQMLVNNKDTGFNYREPRHDAWRENYELYRDKVIVNRLTQRQSVNLPLMKTTLRTLLKDIDEMPVMVFENLDNDKEAEVFQNEYWKYTLEQNNAKIQDLVDKKQDFFFGRTFDDWQVVDGKIKFDVDDPEDLLVDRFMNPYDIDSSRFLIHTHIFKTLSSLEKNPDFDQKAVKDLKEFYGTTLGLVKASDNKNSLEQKNKRMQDMGVTDINDPVLGETYVELTYHYVYRDKLDGKEIPEQIVVYVEAENQVILMKKPQEEIIGTTTDHFWRNHYRYVTWGDDVDKQDFWTDGIADIVRVPNKVLNSWFSQLVENRTLRNFGMNYYDSSLKSEGFIPNTFNPIAWGWYGIPTGGKKLSDVYQSVPIPDLKDSIDEMNYVVELTQKATGATDTQQGVQTENQVTLGEIQLAQGEAKQRTQSISKFYTPAWERRGLLFLKLIEAAKDKLDAVKIYKKGRMTDEIFAREIAPKDWMTKSGYRVKVWSQDEKNVQDTKMIEKLNVAILNMPDNPKLREVFQRKLLEYVDLTPDETNEIMEFEKKKQEAIASGILPTGAEAGGVAGQTASPARPTQRPVQQQIIQ